MSNHVLGLEYVRHDGRGRYASRRRGLRPDGRAGRQRRDARRRHGVDVRLLRVPRAVRVCVAAFGDVESASEAVSAIIAAGIVPTALEIMDKTIAQAVEAHFHAGSPPTPAPCCSSRSPASPTTGRRRSRDRGDRARARRASWRAAPDARERDALWASRKGAAGAIGRIAPNYYIQDACVPRTRLPRSAAPRRCDRAASTGCGRQRLSRRRRQPASAADLRPARAASKSKRSSLPATEILERASSWAGRFRASTASASKSATRCRCVFSTDDLATMARVRDVFDPARRFNPDKIFPSGAVCGEVRNPAPVQANRRGGRRMAVTPSLDPAGISLGGNAGAASRRRRSRRSAQLLRACGEAASGRLLRRGNAAKDGYAPGALRSGDRRPRASMPHRLRASRSDDRGRRRA